MDVSHSSNPPLSELPDVFQVLELLGESIWRRDLRSEAVDVTPGLWASLGYPVSELPRHLEDAMTHFDPADAIRVLAELDAYLADELGAYRTTARVQSATGEWRWLSFSGVVVDRDDNGVATIVGGLIRDITREVMEKRDRTAAERRLADLSWRERQVIHGIAIGETSKEIAAMLGLSPRTVDFYRGRLMEKLGITNVPDLVRLAEAAHLCSEHTSLAPK